MQSENFDNKIKQAAEQHHPEYDGKAWHKMEKLLNRHLPQKDDRRKRGILFLLLFAFLGGGTWLLVSKPWQTSDRTLTSTETAAAPDPSNSKASNPVKVTIPSTSTETTKEVTAPAEKETDNSVVDQPAGTINEKSPSLKTTTEPVINSEKTQRNSVTGTVKKNGVDKPTIEVTGEPGVNRPATYLPPNKIKSHGKDPIAEVTTTNVKEKTPDNKVAAIEGQKASVDPPKTKEEFKSEELKKNEEPVNSKDLAKVKDMEDSKTATDQKDQPAITETKKKESKSNSSKKRNQFFFSFSAAPDVSWVSSNEAGKIRLLTGVGVGYTIKDRLTIRTGFYSGHKKYSANWSDYKPEVVPPNAQYIDNIDADCKVYEIPLNLSYHFAHSKDHNLFAGAGLSSFIMKKEEYVYLYKFPGGSTYTYTKNVDNEYKHYFSVLTLSAGYQYKINRGLSLTVEPYAKLPLGGVGYGKVKLASAGVMLTANISPFQSSKK